MARIRTVKPELFRHEGLQDLEAKHPESKAMLVFIGLWGHCDAQGVFQWKPRQLKLDLLPFLDFDMEETLNLLHRSGQVEKLTCAEGKEYGWIPTFLDHQILSGKEAKEGKKYPDPEQMEKSQNAPVKQQGSYGENRGSSGKDREIPDSQEGNGREEEGNRKRNRKGELASAKKPPQPLDPFFHRLMKAMEEKKGEPFANYAQETENAKKLLARIRAIEPVHTEEAIRAVLETYYRLIKSSDKFWSGQPFTPSRLLSHLEAVMAEAKKSGDVMQKKRDEIEVIRAIYGEEAAAQAMEAMS